MGSLPPGFHSPTLLHQSSRTSVVRAQHSQGSFILKSPARPIPDAQELASYYRECHWRRLLGDSLECQESGGQVFLIRPDCGGLPLDQLRLPPQQLEQVLEQALRQLEVLADQGLVHQEICPSHLLWSPQAGLRLLGWSALCGRATDPAARRYWAPEQSGRLKLKLDGRTDLYGLGISLWQCLSGQLPYPDLDDPLELLHAILAQELPSLEHPWEGILRSLLAKDPQDRPANPRVILAQGVGAPTRPAPTFLGRSLEFQTLEHHLTQVQAGQSLLVAIEGPAGIGKSALLQELRRRWLRSPSLWLGQGQFRSQGSNQGILAALDEVVGQLWAGTNAEVAHWSQLLRQRLESYGSPLLALVPQLAPCLPNALPSQELGEKSPLAITALVACLASPQRPLVLLLDDCQEADQDAGKLLNFLVSDPSLQGLLVIGCWTSLPQNLAQAQALRRQPLAALSSQEVEQWLEQHQCPPAWRRPLLEQSQGNPLLLQALWHLQDPDWSAQAGDCQEILVELFRRLPEENRRLLSLAACWGEAFTASDLADLLGKSPQQLEPLLHQAQQAGVLGAGFRFSHSRLAQAAYQELSPQQRSFHHRLWARWLAQRGSAEQRVHQLWRGLEALDDDEVLEFQQLAGQVAKDLTRIGSLQKAQQLLQAALGQSGQASQRLELLLDYGRICLGLGQLDQVQEVLQELERQTPGPAESMQAQLLSLRLNLAQGQWQDAYRQAQQILTQAGRPSRFQAGMLPLAGSLVQTLWALRGRAPEELAQLPASQDPWVKALQEVQTLSAPLQARLSPETIPLGILRDVRSLLQDGVTAVGAQAWTGYALLLCNGLGQVALGLRFADLALKQVVALGRPDLEPRVACLAYTVVYPWGQALPRVRQQLLAVCQRAFGWGELEAAWLAGLGATILGLVLGEPLPQLHQELQQFQARLQHFGYCDGQSELAALLQAVEVLQGAAAPQPTLPWELDLPIDPLQSVTLLAALQQALVLEQPRRALELLRQGSETLSSVVVGPLSLVFWTYAGVTLYRSLQQGWLSKSQAKPWLTRAQRTLKRWTRNLPARRWRLLWLEAARAHWRGAPPLKVWHKYDAALQGALAQGVRCDAALIAEEIARFWLSLERPSLAETYRLQALALYRQWGALVKVAQLSPPLSVSTPADVDLDTVLRASQALSQEMQLERLLPQLVKLALENAGGQRGVLLLAEPEGWSTALEAKVGQPPQAWQESLDLEAPHPRLPTALLRKTLRTGHLQILDDPWQSPTWATDPFIHRVRPRALLCLPLEQGGQVVGLLYLEQALAAGVFTPQRTAVLTTLSAQMAISLQNARHFAQVLDQRDLRHREALEHQALSARKDALAAVLGIASHDLKNPLAVIQMWMQQLGPDPCSSRLQQVQRNVEAACHRATSLIATYLDVAALEQGRVLELRLRPLALDRLIENELEFLLDTLPPEERSQLNLEWDLAPVQAEVDPERIRQVVGNLVGNALKYCPRGTSIQLLLTSSPGAWQLEVIDQGPGLAPDLQAKLFQPFERRHHGIAGSGLGLWICRVILEAHQGQLSLDSPWQGQGCRFCCQAPLET